MKQTMLLISLEHRPNKKILLGANIMTLVVLSQDTSLVEHWKMAINILRKDFSAKFKHCKRYKT